jgi:hypothetical protein
MLASGNGPSASRMPCAAIPPSILICQSLRFEVLVVPQRSRLKQGQDVRLSLFSKPAQQSTSNLSSATVSPSLPRCVLSNPAGRVPECLI